MAARHFLHRTATGERFDLLAHRYYGDATRLSGLVRANRAPFLGDLFRAFRGEAADPHLPLVFTEPGTVTVPVVDAAQIAAELLPPWKR